MPKNPYDFVPFENNAPQRDLVPNTQEKLDSANAYSGLITCELTTETPLFIHGERQNQQNQPTRSFFTRNGKPTIPASTLKGLIRSVAEVTSDSCVSVISDEWQGSLPKGYEPCTSKDKLCLCCGMFGMTEKGDQGEEKKSAIGGRVYFTDGNAVESNEVIVNVPNPRGGPKPTHKLFYFDQSTNECLGRKFYYHHQNYRRTLNSYNMQTIKLKARTGKFIFHIRFDNLWEDELATLLYSLELSFDDNGNPAMRHHLSYGKPYGLGTVKINIIDLKLELPKEIPIFDIKQISQSNLSDLDSEVMPDIIKENFAKKSISLQEDAIIEALLKGKEWKISNKTQNFYIKKINDKLNVYLNVGCMRFLKYNLTGNNHIEEMNPSWWRKKAKSAWNRSGSKVAKSKLEQILRWPQTENFQYPSYGWFHGPTVNKVTIQDYQNGKR